MLGNDIVDLHDLDARPSSFRARFDERVFSPAERRAIARDANPLARRWAHWAAKEAVYKLARQKDTRFVFSPRRLQPVFLAETIRPGGRLERRGRLALEGLPAGVGMKRLEIELRSFETPESVHVVAAPAKADWRAIDFAVDELGPNERDPSAAVREMARSAVSRELGVAKSRLAFGRRKDALGARGRIPSVLLDGAEIQFSLSFSHHGRFMSYAMGLQIDHIHHINHTETADNLDDVPNADSIEHRPVAWAASR